MRLMVVRHSTLLPIVSGPFVLREEQSAPVWIQTPVVASGFEDQATDLWLFDISVLDLYVVPWKQSAQVQATLHANSAPVVVLLCRLALRRVPRFLILQMAGGPLPSH